MKEKNNTQRYTRDFVSIIYPMLIRKNKLFRVGKKENGEGSAKFLSVFSIFAWEIIKRWCFLCLFIFTPVILLEKFRPGLVGDSEKLIVFIWFWMIIIREGLVYTEVLDCKESDRIMYRSFNISPKDNFLGKFVFKIWTEFIYHVAILLIFKVSIIHTICLAFMTMSFRIIGERRELKRYDKYEKIDFEKRRRSNLIIQIVCVCASYGFPLALGIMSSKWFLLINPIVTLIVLAKAALDWRGLSKYKGYDFVVREVLNKGAV